MNKTGLVILLSLLAIRVCTAQDNLELYSARALWHEINKTEYRSIKEKQLNGIALGQKEGLWLNQYEEYLKNYFQNLSAEEKQLYFEQKANWYAEAGLPEQLAFSPETKTYRDPNLLIKHMVYSGIYGGIYGGLLVGILDVENESWRSGLPLLLAGGSILVPLVAPGYKDINNQSLWLKSHGKSVGLGHGFLLGAALFGNDAFGSGENPAPNAATLEKITKSLGLLASVSLGQIGFTLGKNKGWTEGQVSLYQYFGYIAPLTTAAIVFSTGAENARTYGITMLASAPLGYYTADKLGQKIDYTRGDIVSVTNATSLGFLYGASILLLLEPESNAAILIPTTTSILGSGMALLNHRNYHITRQQGRRLIWASAGSFLVGLGTVVIIEPEEESMNVLIPTVFATIGYSVLNRYYKNHPGTDLGHKYPFFENSRFALHPESLLWTRQNQNLNYLPPLVSFSTVF
ncbi:MAG: hypothetical protein IPM71_12345 [Bacteroidota bacterium]|nr:MAG: hypothetical protein IPM71_12345 [Bacteroidota bacterium]